MILKIRIDLKIDILNFSIQIRVVFFFQNQTNDGIIQLVLNDPSFQIFDMVMNSRNKFIVNQLRQCNCTLDGQSTRRIGLPNISFLTSVCIDCGRCDIHDNGLVQKIQFKLHIFVPVGEAGRIHLIQIVVVRHSNILLDYSVIDVNLERCDNSDKFLNYHISLLL